MYDIFFGSSGSRRRPVVNLLFLAVVHGGWRSMRVRVEQLSSDTSHDGELKIEADSSTPNESMFVVRDVVGWCFACSECTRMDPFDVC
jgi:hypothetical protein